MCMCVFMTRSGPVTPTSRTLVGPIEILLPTFDLWGNALERFAGRSPVYMLLLLLLLFPVFSCLLCLSIFFRVLLTATLCSSSLLGAFSAPQCRSTLHLLSLAGLENKHDWFFASLHNLKSHVNSVPLERIFFCVFHVLVLLTRNMKKVLSALLSQLSTQLSTQNFWHILIFIVLIVSMGDLTTERICKSALKKYYFNHLL